MATGRHATSKNPVLPDRYFARTEEDVEESFCEILAIEATAVARALMPKLTGAGARGLRPIWGRSMFGITWEDNYVWYQNQGISPFTMDALQGKVIPMWVDDPYGDQLRRNPKSRTRVTEDGRTQILIFRRAARKGEKKIVTETRWAEGIGGRRQRHTFNRVVDAHYPGAPGRVSRRYATRPFKTEGKIAGRIARGNTGVYWRHPGLHGKYFLNEGIQAAADSYGVSILDVWLGESTEEVPYVPE